MSVDSQLLFLFQILFEAIMSVCRKEGKDIIIFADKADHDIPSKVTLPELEPQPGLIFPNGEINWNCPCLGGMATGPCGVEFREAFSCFHYSEAEPKGSDCVELFKEMQSCMTHYPALYDNRDGKGDDDDEDSLGMNMDQTPSATEQPDKTLPEAASLDTKEKQ